MAIKTTQIVFLEDYTKNGYAHFRDNVFSISKNFKRLGSFWTNQLPQKTRDQAKTLSSIALYTNTISKIENTRYNFLNKSSYLYETNGVFDLTKVYNFPVENATPETPATSPLILNVWNEDKTALIPNLNVTIIGLQDENNNVTLDVKPAENLLQTAILSTTGDSESSFDISIANGIRFTKIFTDPSTQLLDWVPPILYNGIDFYQDKGVLKITNPNCLKDDNGNQLALQDIFENKKLFYSGYISEFSPQGQSLFNSLIGINNIAASPQEYYAANYINGSKQSIKDFERLINVALGRVCLYGHKKASLIKISNNNFLFEDISNAETLTERENEIINNTQDQNKQKLVRAYNTFILKQTADSTNTALPLFPYLSENTIFFEDDLVQPVIKIMYNRASEKNSDGTYTWWDNYSDKQLPAQEISEAWQSGIFNNTTKNKVAAETAADCQNIVKSRPTTLFIYINWVLLNDIWNQNTQISKYWDNKYPSVTYLLQDIVNIVKTYAPLGTLPLILITDMDSEPSEITIKDINLSNLLN